MTSIPLLPSLSSLLTPLAGCRVRMGVAWIVRAAVGCLFMALTGCATLSDLLPDSDAGEPPMKLVDIAPEITVETLWSAQVGEGTKSHYLELPPLVLGGKVIAVDHQGLVKAFDAMTGELLWKTELNRPITGSPGGGHGLIVLGTRNALVVALDAADGSIVWKHAVSSAILSAAAVAEGVVVTRSIDGKIYGLDASDGSRLWVYQYNVPVLTVRGVSNPVIVGDKVIVGLASGKLVALSLKEGRLLWETTVAVPRGETEIDRLVDIDSDPVVYGEYLYAVAYNGRIASVWLANGGILWAREMSAHADLGVDKEAVYVTDSEGYVWALDRRTGGSLWRQSKLLRRQVTAPVVYKEYVVVGDFAGYVHWLAKEDGHFVGRIRVGDEGIAGAPVAANGILYIYSMEGILKAVSVSSR